MIPKLEFQTLLTLASEWAEEQEEFISQNGVPLNDDQQIDAYLIGVKHIQKVRLLKVTAIPLPTNSKLKSAAQMAGLLTESTAGTTFRYGIYIRAEFWNNRNLIVHELTHTMQYERIGGFNSFLQQYLDEIFNVGYPYGSLEQEARQMEKQICI